MIHQSIASELEGLIDACGRAAPVARIIIIFGTRLKDVARLVVWQSTGRPTNKRPAQIQNCALFFSPLFVCFILTNYDAFPPDRRRGEKDSLCVESVRSCFARLPSAESDKNRSSRLISSHFIPSYHRARSLKFAALGLAMRICCESGDDAAANRGRDEYLILYIRFHMAPTASEQ